MNKSNPRQWLGIVLLITACAEDPLAHVKQFLECPSCDPYDFGTVALGDRACLTRTLFNRGDLAIRIERFEITAQSEMFSVTATIAAIPPSGEFPLEICFTPREVARYEGQLTIENDSSNAPRRTIDLVGRGMPYETVDGGVVTIDGGVLHVDGGVSTIDGGVTVIDAGPVAVDAGVVAIDGGVVFIDGGLPDAGCVPSAPVRQELERTDRLTFANTPRVLEAGRTISGFVKGCAGTELRVAWRHDPYVVRLGNNPGPMTFDISLLIASDTSTVAIPCVGLSGPITDTQTTGNVASRPYDFEATCRAVPIGTYDIGIRLEMSLPGAPNPEEVWMEFVGGTRAVTFLEIAEE